MTGIKDNLSVVDTIGLSLQKGEEWEPLLLTTQEQFQKYWPLAQPLVEKCVLKAMHGELTVDDIYQRATHSQMFVFIVKSDTDPTQPKVKLALVLEIIRYPQLPALNIVALAGSDLEEFYSRYWSHVCGWAYMNGARAIEGLMSPAMVKVVSKFGFKQTYTHMRLRLDEGDSHERTH